MIGQRLQYFCVECGKELLNRTFIDNCGYHSSQECIKCGYVLLFGTIKKKTPQLHTTAGREQAAIIK